MAARRNYGRSSMGKGDNSNNPPSSYSSTPSLASLKYAGFHPSTELSGGSWNSVRWVRPSAVSTNRHANLTGRFDSQKMDTYTTANRSDRDRTSRREQYYRRDTTLDSAWRPQSSNVSRAPYWRPQSGDSRPGRTTPLSSVIADYSTTFRPKTDSSGNFSSSGSRRNSISALQDNNNVLQDAVTALRATADSLATGKTSKRPDESTQRSESRRNSLVRDNDLGHSSYLSSSIREGKVGSGTNRFLSGPSAISRSWHSETSSGKKEHSSPRYVPPRRDSTISEYGTAFCMSGLRRDSLSSRTTPGSSFGYNRDISQNYSSRYLGRTVPSGSTDYRRGSYSNFGASSTNYHSSPRRNSLLSPANKMGLSGSGNFRSIAEAPRNPSNPYLSTYRPSLSTAPSYNYLSPSRRGSASNESTADLISYYRSKSDSSAFNRTPVTTAPPLRPFSVRRPIETSGSRSSVTSVESSSSTKNFESAPRKFLKKRREDSEGYDSSSTDNAHTITSIKKVKNYRKRSSQSRSRQGSKALSSSFMTGSSSSGVKSMKDRTQSSSEEESNKGASFETRMRQRRRRLNKSKVLVQSENLNNSVCGSDSKIPRFSVEKVYLQTPLQSQENLRPLDIMSTSAPAWFSLEKRHYPTVQENVVEQSDGDKFDEVRPEIEKSKSPTLDVGTTDIPVPLCPFPAEVPDIVPKNSDLVEMDVSESSDTLVPDQENQENQEETDAVFGEATISIDPILESLRRPLDSSERVERVFKVPTVQAIDFSGLEEFSAVVESNESKHSVRDANIVNKQKSRINGGETAVITGAVICEDEKAPRQEQQPAPAFRAPEPLINALEKTENKIPAENSNFGASTAVQKTTGKDDRNGGEETPAAARSSEKILEFSTHQKDSSPLRTETPRFPGAKRIVVLHSDENETTVYEQSTILPSSLESSTDVIGGDTENLKHSAGTLRELAPGKINETDEIKKLILRPKQNSKPASRPASANLEAERLKPKEAVDRRNSIPIKKESILAHVLGSVDKEVVDLLNLGEELTNSRRSLNTSGTDSESGFRTPEVQDLPQPKRAEILFTDTVAQSLIKRPNNNNRDPPFNEEDISGNTTPILQNRPDSTDSFASGFLTANSDTESMRDRTFVLTARPQPFCSSTENLSSQRQRYGPVDPSLPGIQKTASSSDFPAQVLTPVRPVGSKQQQTYPVMSSNGIAYFAGLQRTSSTASNESWASAASSARTGGSLEAAAKKVDEMLRLARRKHQANRSKFRDAMDHLDQIYEEIKKEADDVGVAPTKNGHKTDGKSASTSSYQPKPLFTPSSKQNTPPKVVIYENLDHQIQPPIRDGKFDFTKKWLENDLQSLATDPGEKPDLLQFGPSEADQHSVGSASAEIALITGKESLVGRKVIPDLVPQKHQAVIKPSPVRYASYQDVSAPDPPIRKDSLSSVDSARVKVGKFLERHVQCSSTDEPQGPALDLKANLGHVRRKADFFGRISDNDSDRDRHSPSFGFDRKPPLSGFVQMAQLKRAHNAAQKHGKAAFLGNLSDEDMIIVDPKPIRRPYAESTRSLPIYGGGSQVPELRKAKPKYELSPVQFAPPPQPKMFKQLQNIAEPWNSSSNTLTETEIGRSKLPSSEEPRFGRGRRTLGSKALQTVDHLVAELELNTEEQELSPRAFPTAGIAQYGVDFSALPEDNSDLQFPIREPVKPIAAPIPQKPVFKVPEVYKPVEVKSINLKRVNLYEDFNEAQKVLLDATVQKPKFVKPKPYKESSKDLKVMSVKTITNLQTFSPAIENRSAETKNNHPGHFSEDNKKAGYRSPFMTINEEKLGQSKVVNMKSMFEPIPSTFHAPKLPVVTSQPPGKGTIPAPIPFKPLEVTNVMESSFTGNLELYNMPENSARGSPRRTDPSKNASNRAFQQIQSRSAAELLPIRSVVPGISPSPGKFINFSSHDFQPTIQPLTKLPKKSELSSSFDDDDYDNVVLPAKGTQSATNTLRHPGPIKINDMRLGEEGASGPEKSSKNPIKNLLRRLKSQPDNRIPIVSKSPNLSSPNSDSAPRQSSTLSLNEPIGARLAYDIHKSRSVSDAWSENSSLKLEPRLVPSPAKKSPTKAIMKPPKGKGGRKFWTPWKK